MDWEGSGEKRKEKILVVVDLLMILVEYITSEIYTYSNMSFYTRATNYVSVRVQQCC